MPENTDDRSGKAFHINCKSRYFEIKYSSPVIIRIEKECRVGHNPAGFLFIGRILAEGMSNTHGEKVYYGHVQGLGEYVCESELGEMVVE